MARNENSSFMTVANARRVARSLGWLSLGLGLAELLAPRRVAEPLGARPRDSLVRAFGAREIASGLAILLRDNPATGMWSRVGGDLLDIAVVAAARDSRREGVPMAGLAVVGAVLLVDVLSAAALHRSHEALRSQTARRAGMRLPPRLRQRDLAGVTGGR